MTSKGNLNTMPNKWLIVTEILIIVGSLYLIYKTKKENQNATKQSSTGLFGPTLHGRYESEPY